MFLTMHHHKGVKTRKKGSKSLHNKGVNKRKMVLTVLNHKGVNKIKNGSNSASP